MLLPAGDRTDSVPEDETQVMRRDVLGMVATNSNCRDVHAIIAVGALRILLDR